MEEIKTIIPEFLLGGGEMGERIRSFDWNKTSLGNPENWHQSLKTCVRIMLTSPQPMFVWWGNELINIYNDAYIQVIGDKHPGGLGQPAEKVWKEIWHEIGLRCDIVMQQNRGTFDDGLLLLMNRYGYDEETYFKFSYSPIPGDKGPAGIFCACTEETESIVGERQLNTLQNLSKALSELITVEEVYKQTIEILQQNGKDFPFVVIYERKEDGKKLVKVGETSEKLQKIFPPEIDVLTNPHKFRGLMEAISSNKPLIVDDLAERFGDLPSGEWNVPPTKGVVIPVFHINQQHPFAILKMGICPFRPLNEKYQRFFQLVADQVAIALSNALAIEEERKRIEALEEINRVKTVFFSNISHEFRTPLTLMLGPLEEMINASQNTLSVSDRKNLETTHRNAMRLLKLVNTLLDFSLIESGRQKARYQLTDIATFTRNLAANFRSVVEKAGLNFTVDINNSVPPVYLDMLMWEKIVFNLLSNAFKYTLHGTITVSLHADENSAVLQVADTGVGIPASEIPKMFERFHRVQQSIGRTYEGTGIGLSLVKELVKVHGGTIGVDSREGEGSIFTVTIPLGNKHLESSQIIKSEYVPDENVSDSFVEESKSLLDKVPVEDEPEIDSKLKPASTILIVDDNADMRDHIRMVLGKEYEVMTANNGLDALHRIHERVPSLVLTDIMMPIMDGIRLLSEIRKDEKTSNIPVIFLTARAGEESRIEGYETGADDYLVKPFSSRELRARVAAQLKMCQVRLQNEQKTKSFLMQAPAAIAIVQGQDHVFTLANPLFQDLFRRTEKQLLGKTIEQVWPDYYQQGIHELFDKVFESGDPFSAVEYPVTWRELGKKITRFYNFVAFPIRDNESSVTDIMIHAIEVTDQVLARQKIEESEERFRTMASEAPIFVWVTDENLQTTYINPTGLDYFNLEHTVKIPELSWKNFIHPEDIEMVLAVMKDAITNRKSYTLEMRLKNGVTGDYRWFMDKGVPRYENEKFVGFIGTSFDIHDRLNAEKAIKESEERFRALTKATTSIVWTTGPDGGFIIPQYSWENYTGQPWEEHKGYGWANLIHEDDRENVKMLWAEALAKGNEYHSMGRIWSSRYQSYRYFEASGVPIKNKQGEIIEWVGMVTDVHEKVLDRIKIESLTADLELKVKERTLELENKNKELQESQSFLQQLIDSSVEYVSVFDTNLNYVTVNRRFEEVIKKSRQEIFGKHIFDIAPMAKGTIQFESILKALKGEIVHLENIQSIAIPEIYVDTYFVPWYVQNEIRGVIVMARDVSEIIRSEIEIREINLALEHKNIELEKINKELESYTFIASHDLQEPLRKIQTFIELIERNKDNVEASRTYYSKIRKAAQRMSQLIQSLLAYSKLSDADETKIDTDLNIVYKNVLTDLELLIREKGATIKCDKLPTIKAVPIQITQLFTNLLNNSLKFSRNNPIIRITSTIIDPGKMETRFKIKPNCDFVKLTFKDNGIGFEPKYNEQVFKLFQRLHGRHEYSGTGVGLSIVKRIVEHHQGYIQASGKPGSGTRVIVYLPMRP